MDVEFFRSMDEMARDKREYNVKHSTRILADNGIKFEKKNHGYHLIVHTKKGIVDFWPSRGRWIPRWQKSPGRGVMNLINLCT